MYKQRTSLYGYFSESILLVLALVWTVAPYPVCVIVPFYPSELINVQNWYLTLPIGLTSSPITIEQPKLATFSNAYFQPTIDSEAVSFISTVGGVHTSGSSYSRSELREMNPTGLVQASWDIGRGVHTLTVVHSIQKVAAIKQSVIVAQIHDANQYVIIVQLYGTILYAKSQIVLPSGSNKFAILDNDYVLGTVFTTRISVVDGMVRIYYNDMVNPVGSIQLAGKGNYFKAGSYIQANGLEGDDPNDYAEVWMFSVDVSHSPALP